MRLPISWLASFIEGELYEPKITKTLTLAGIEVEEVTPALAPFDQVIVAQVLSVERHPNADRLQVAQVSDGRQIYQVVCGAPNCRPHLRVALALVGATLRPVGEEPLRIKRSKIRGVESHGMLCAGVELGISSEAEGILELDEHLPLGSDLAQYYGDTILTLGLTPNLGHAFSVFGVARELAALIAPSGATLRPLPPLELAYGTPAFPGRIIDQELCPSYAYAVLEIGEGGTPLWMTRRLEACGMRPIHPVVDVTNYVLCELGQPLHAFDRDALSQEIQVRRASVGESIETLDGKQRQLTEEVLVIADAQGPIAVAGVMGGKNAEVHSQTRRIVLESAYFQPSAVRRSGRILGLSTEASKHFERGVDPNRVHYALERAITLLEQIVQAKRVEQTAFLGRKQVAPKEILCRLSAVNGLLGTSLSLGEVEGFFRNLHFTCRSEGQETLRVLVPAFRSDIQAEVDLIEEIARLVGYDNIPKKSPRAAVVPGEHTPLFLFERHIRHKLAGLGLQEFLTCDLIGPSALQIAPDPKTAQETMVKVLNPTSIEQSILRTSLMQGLLGVVKHNVDRENLDIQGFEVGRVHVRVGPHSYREPPVVGIILTGARSMYHIDPKPRPVDFFDLKGVIEHLLCSLHVNHYHFRQSHLEVFHPGRQAVVLVKGVEVGALGQIHPDIQRRLDVPRLDMSRVDGAGRLYFAELNVADLYAARQAQWKMEPLPLYPSSSRDWTLCVEETLAVQQMVRSIQHIPSKLLESVSLLDIFYGDSVGMGKKNVTLHFVYRDREKTVSQEEVDQEHNRIIDTAQQMLSEGIR